MTIRYKNNWIHTKQLSEMTNTEYDAVIVGTGPGGGAVLQRLCQMWKHQGAKKIAVLEKGGKLFHSHAQNIPTQNVNTSRDDLLPNNSTPIGERLPQFSGATMVYALGGRSLFWNAATPRPIAEELEKWPINKVELDAYYRMAEKLLHVSTEWAAYSPMQEWMLMRLHAAGILEAQDMPLAIDLAPPRMGEVHSNPWYSSINALAAGQFDRSYDLAPDAYVHKVNRSGSRATGVEVIDTATKRNYTIRAKNVVVSASTLETPRILLNSGIPGPAIGRYLTGHVSMIGVGTISPKRLSDIIENLSILKFETKDDPYQIQILGPDQYWSYQQFEDRKAGDKLFIAFAAFGRVESRRANRVYLERRRDEYGVPYQQVQYELSEKDRETAKKVEQGIRDAAKAMGVTLDESTMVLRPPGADMHESCTCRMGDDPNTSATNRHGQIHGVRGLYVADNSALPSLTAAGPVLSNTALALRVADHIVRHS